MNDDVVVAAVAQVAAERARWEWSDLLERSASLERLIAARAKLRGSVLDSGGCILRGDALGCVLCLSLSLAHLSLSDNNR